MRGPTVIDGYTKEDLHAHLVQIIRLAASRPNHQSWPIATGQYVNALQGNQADRIVRRMAANWNAKEWEGVRFTEEQLKNLIYVFATYRRMEWSVN
jgi:hypothetical protein